MTKARVAGAGGAEGVEGLLKGNGTSGPELVQVGVMPPDPREAAGPMPPDPRQAVGPEPADPRKGEGEGPVEPKVVVEDPGPDAGAEDEAAGESGTDPGPPPVTAAERVEKCLVLVGTTWAWRLGGEVYPIDVERVVKVGLEPAGEEGVWRLPLHDGRHQACYALVRGEVAALVAAKLGGKLLSS